MRNCKDICRFFSEKLRNYQDGRKCCRRCTIFLKTEKVYCPCCSNPLATKGRANITQLIRRAEQKTISKLTEVSII